MKQYLTATIQALSKSELDDIIDPYFIRGIKDKDPHPEVKVYSVGHEGKANLHLPGVGQKTLTWVQAAVQWVRDKLKVGTAVFDRHDPNTNSHEGRTQIGEVVGTAVKQIGDRLNTLAAIYIYPQFKSRPLDVASIEAEIEYAHDGFQAWPTAIKSVSGVALSNSGIDTPGFPGATLLGAVQAYVQAFGSEIGEKLMNLSDVKQAVKDLGLSPSQVFGVDDIMGDSKVVEKVKEEKKNVIAGSERIQNERDGLKEKVVKLENEKAESDKRLQQTQMQSKSATVIDGILTERKLDDKAKAYVKRNLNRFTTTAGDEDTLKKELGTFVDTTHKDYQELAKDVFGIDTSKTKDQTTQQSNQQFKLPPELLAGGQQQTDQGTNTPVYRPRDERLRDEMNPAINPLIPGGKAAQEALTPK
uniref:Uncharacterized protein n=1 Tax=viral metagenome TaxID=1070528 RepID=A0A6M3KZX4_9ZZZZ